MSFSGFDIMVNTNWIDITYPINDGMVHWPGDIEVKIDKLSDIDKGADANVTSISMSAHTGTHMDAPNHFLKDGKTMDQIPFEAVIGAARVLKIQDNKCITKEELMTYRLQKGERILFKTANSNSDWTKEPFKKDYVYISVEAGKYLAEVGIQTIGIDYLSVGGMEDGDELHKILLKKDIWLIEGLNLKDVDPGTYELLCLPMKISGVDGAPVRALIKKA